MRLSIFVVALVFSLSCAHLSGPALVQRNEAAEPAVTLLQAGRFDDAQSAATQLLVADAGNPRAHLVLALTQYRVAVLRLYDDLATTLLGAFAAQQVSGGGGINTRYLQFALDNADKELAAVDSHLTAAAQVADVSLEQCFACWPVDWNRDGTIDERDLRLFQVERDADDAELASDNTRRTPTFRFDLGDVYWAKAMVAFQRAVLAALAAYDFNELTHLVRGASAGPVVLRLISAASVHKARELVLSGLEAADLSRRAILAETDDDREWLPNPRQKSHPMPLPVDQALFDTWEGVVADLRALLRGETGLDVAALAQLGDRQWQDPPHGYLNVARLFEAPGDIVLDVRHLERLGNHDSRQDVEAVLRDVFGDKYVPQMKASPIAARLTRMAGEVDRGQETIQRKLRYLLWLN